MIRHAAAAAFPVGPLPVAVIEPSLPALLVPPVGRLSVVAAVLSAGIGRCSIGGPGHNDGRSRTPRHSRHPGKTVGAGALRGSPSPPFRRDWPTATRLGRRDLIYGGCSVVFRVGTKTPIAANGRGFPFPPSAKSRARPRIPRLAAAVTRFALAGPCQASFRGTIRETTIANGTHDAILGVAISATPVLLVLWIINRMRHRERSFQSAVGVSLLEFVLVPSVSAGAAFLWVRSGGEFNQALGVGVVLYILGSWMFRRWIM